MSEPPRVLFVAEPAAAVEALGAVREGGPVQAQLATSADVLREALGAGGWSAVVFVPGGPVEDVEAAAYVPDGLPFFVVAESVPLLLADTAAQAVAPDALGSLVGRIARADAPPSAPAEPEAPEPAAPEPAPEAALPPADPPPSDPPPPDAPPSDAPSATASATADPFGDLAFGDLAFEDDAPAFEGAPFDEVSFDDVSPAPPALPDPAASLADHLPIGLYRTTADGRVLYANPALADLLGAASVEDLYARDVRADFGYPRRTFEAEVEAEGSVRNLVVTWDRAGETVHTRENARAVRDADGRLLYYEGTMEDVTAEAETLRDLRDAEASLAVVAEHAPHVLYRLRYADGGPTFDYLSPAVEALTGYAPAEVAALGGLSALVTHRDVREGEGLTDGPVDGADRYCAVYRMATAHGERWVENAARTWRDGDGRVLGLVGVLQDVTERKQREDDLADEAQTALIRQRALVDLAQLQGADASGAPAAAIVAATLGAAAVSIWECAPGAPPRPLAAPPAGADVSLDGHDCAAVAEHVGAHRALAVSDVDADDRVGAIGLDGLVRAYGLRSLLVARSAGPAAWPGSSWSTAATSTSGRGPRPSSPPPPPTPWR